MAPVCKWVSLWRKLWRLPFAQQLLLLQIGLLLVFIRLSLALVPFGTLHALLAKLANRPHNSQRIDERQTILWATRSLGRCLLGDRPCLAEALIVQTFFRKHGYPAELRIGVRKAPSGQLLGHAWVESAGEIVIGGAESPQEFAVFPLPILPSESAG
jgi:hypothetical protein